MKGVSGLPLPRKWSILLVLAASFIILTALHDDLFQLHGDFQVAFQAAQRLLSGANLYEHGYLYPPLYAFCLTLLVPCSEPVARWIVLSASALALILAAVLAFRAWANNFKITCGTWEAAGACAIAILLTQDQIYHVFREGQNDLFILLGFSLAFYWLDRRPLTAGAILGIIVDIKYQALFLLPLLLFRARWRLMIGLLAGILIGAFLPALLIGWSRNLTYLQTILHGLLIIINPSPPAQSPLPAAAPPLLWIGNITITSGIARIFNGQGWAIQSAIDCIGILVMLIFLFLWKNFHKRGIAFIWRTPMLTNSEKDTALVGLEWNILLLCMLVFSPDATRRHLMLLFSFNLFAVMMLLFPKAGVKRLPIVLAIVLAQLGQLNFGSIYYGQYIGLPGWGYLTFLLLILPSCLAYYQSAGLLELGLDPLSCLPPKS